jgi:phosphoglycerate dehydrogenase-like enzyme
MEVLYTKRHPLLAEHEHQANVRYAGLEELLQTSDFVSLHAPHTNQTEKMINTKALDLMKSSAVLINTARGGLVDEEALVSALQEGCIGGAGLDAFLYEPLPQGHPLVDCPKVLFSPHVGGGTGGGQKGMMTDVINNLDSLRSKSELKGLVDV